MEEIEIQAQTSKFQLCENPDIGSDISKILLVHDGNDTDDVSNRALIDFLSVRGYHVVTLRLDDTAYKSTREFVQEFEQFVKSERKNYVWAIVHYARTETTDVCMYCSEPVPKHSLLLKQAFATLYVHMGRERCTIVCPPRCCDCATAYLPRKQVEGMVICTSGDEDDDEQSVGQIGMVDVASDTVEYPPFVWARLEDKLTTIRLIDSHKPDLRHCRNLIEEVAEVKENPLTEEQVLRLVTLMFSYFGQDLPERFAAQVGISTMEWEEYVKRSGDQTLYLVLRRSIIVHKDGAWEKIAVALETVSAQEVDADHLTTLAQLAELIRQFGSKTPVLLSTWPQLEQIRERIIHGPGTRGAGTGASGASDSGAVTRKGFWKPGVENPEPDDGTHLDKLESKFIPPYLRERLLDTSQSSTAEEAETLKEHAAKTIERAQQLDQEYERQKLAREMQERELMGGFSMKDRLPTKLESRPTVE